MSTPEAPRPPFPPFDAESAAKKVRLAEDAWNSRDPERVALAYTPDTIWRNRAEFPVGRAQVVEFLRRKWARELDYRLIKELWAYTGNRIAVRFAYEWRDDSGHCSAPTATRTGNSTSTASCTAASPPSMISRSAPRTGNTTGRSDAGPTTIRGCPTLVSDSPAERTQRQPATKLRR